MKYGTRLKKSGQAVIEYAGAMIVAAVVVATIVTGTGQNQWVYNAYSGLFNAAGNVLANQLTNLQ